jgi:hypothetical protein
MPFMQYPVLSMCLLCSLNVPLVPQLSLIAHPGVVGILLGMYSTMADERRKELVYYMMLVQAPVACVDFTDQLFATASPRLRVSAC